MPSYKPPVVDFEFLIFDVLEIEKHKDLNGYAELDRATVHDVLEGACTFMAEVLQPLNRSGDEEGCQYENGVVRTPKGLKEAYKAYCEAGWNRLGVPEQYGGAGLPIILTFAVAEMGSSSNQAFTMYPGLTNAACSALIATGAPWMRERVVPMMVAGEWTGTMCLTEPHCGTDLRLMKTKAVEQPDGTYKLSGTKIFISGGDRDLTNNIIHMVIAKISDESGRIHDDLSTVNFFMVPKFLVAEDGKMGARNGVSTGSIEKKMGIKANATAVLNFDEAKAWRLGPKPEPRGAGEKGSSSAGMKGMFGMMNAARLGVGVQGVAVAEVAYQNAAAYAKERLVGRSLTGPKAPDKPADPEIVHPDVRRMLLFSRAAAEGGRSLATWIGFLLGVATSKRSDLERQEAADLADLLTPVIKAFCTDLGFDAANASMQVFGGHGYIRDHGMEQFVRDSRINQIYEGANGVQALDLVGRKLSRNGGRAPFALFRTINEFLGAEDGEAMKAFVDPVKAGLARLQEATMWLAQNGLKNPDNAGAASYDYLHMFGLVVIGYLWARQAKAAQAALAKKPANATFYEAKLVTARFWMERMMPDTAALSERIKAGAEGLMMLDAASF
jgi:alkylation response protein AidB-like acyl-CoA dehydrogenase